jgi:acetyl-CoA C-acetyltransferase
VIDPRTPVLVGAAELEQRVDDVASSVEPLECMRRVAVAAAEDAGAPSLLPATDAIYVPRGLWRYPNPGAWLGEVFGASRPHTGLGPISGSTVQRMLSYGARDIAAGRRDVVLLVGAECEYSKRRAKAEGIDLEWSDPAGPDIDETFGDHTPDFGSFERRYRPSPIHYFSLLENALRHYHGESLQDHRARVAALWARFSQVASKNPHAWIQQAYSAEELATPSDENRLVAYPYTKRMVANMVVDKAAALLLCSAEAAQRQGVPESRWVYPHAATDVLASVPGPERPYLHSQPAIGLGGARALELADQAPESIDHVDLYSCFPSAVQIGAAELGFPLERDLTLTGGLTFGGGPFNSGVLHALATLVTRLREAPETTGFVSSIGGYMSKHAFGVYGGTPSPGGFQYEDCTGAALALASRPTQEEFAGGATVEAFAQQAADRSIPRDAILVSALTDDGTRVFARSEDPELFRGVEVEELCGRRVVLSDGVFRVA